jgi:hypothetical protein
MNPADAKQEFIDFLAKRLQRLDSLTALAAAEAMLAFYRHVRADGCSFDRDEDMLLFQWHAFETPHGAPFVYDMTRQLIFQEKGEEQIRQLSLSCRFAVTAGLAALGDGDRWCESLAGLDEFESYVLKHAATVAVGARTDASIALRFESAE